MSEQNFEGKKVFFLYPHSAVEDYFHLFLIKNEFEVYLLRDHHYLEPLLAKFPTSIVFLNIDEWFKEEEWLQLTQKLTQNFPDLVIGVFTAHNNPTLSQRYLIDLGIKGGFITLRSGMENARQTILKALLVNEARGRRRYIRVRPVEGTATFNIKYRGELATGVVYDISSVGISAAFDKEIYDFPENTLLRDVQIMFRGLRVKVNLLISIKRAQPGKKTTYVMMFGEDTLPTDREKISTIILRGLQYDLEKWLDEIPKKV